MNSLHSRCVSHAGDTERMLAIRSPFRKEEIHGPGGCEAKKQMRLIRRADGVSEAMMPNNAFESGRAMKRRAAQRER